MVQRIRISLRRGTFSESPPCILVACSGGRDSVVLAHVLSVLAGSGEIKAEIIHVDHAIREDSAHDEEIVRDFAERRGLPFHSVRLDPGVVARHPGAGSEEALRRERYQAIADVSREIDASAVAVAHHQQDQAETVLLHLIRGAGLHGASGMREWSDLRVPWWASATDAHALTLWRPLLGEPVASVEAWHRDYGLPLAEDATNLDRMYRRNAIRHDILPKLESVSPGAVANLARFAGLAAEDDALLERLAGEQIEHSGDDLPRTSIIDAEPAIQRRVVRRWIRARGFDGELSLNRIDAVRKLAYRNRSGASIEIGGGWRVYMVHGVLHIER